MKKILNALVIYSLLISTTGLAQSERSLSGDNWKNPRRTKTWTPPSVTDTLVGTSAAQTITNKTINGATLGGTTNVTGPISGDVNVTGGITTTVNPPLTDRSGKVVTTDTLKQSTSSLNSLVDGSFEGSTLTEWVLSTAGTKTIATTGCIESPTNAKCMSVVSSLENILTNTWYGGASFPAKTSAVCEGWLKTDKDTDVAVTLGTSTIARQTITGDGVWRKFYLNYSTNGTDSPKCEVRNPATTTYLLDITSHGVKDETGVMAKFDNTTGWVDSGYIASDFTSFGTVTDIKLKSKREKDKLRIVGSFLAGTGTGTLATFKIKFNGVYLSTPSLFDTSSAPILAGDYFRIVTADNDPNKGGKLLINSGSSTVNFSRPILYGAGAGMPNVLETGSNISPASRVVFIDATIPIAEWSSQTNAAIVACQEGELKCYNSPSAKITKTTWTIASSNLSNWITGCSISGTNITCNFSSSLAITVPMVCEVNTAQSTDTTSGRDVEIVSNTTSSIVFRGIVQTNGLPYVLDNDVNIKCDKQIPDTKNGTERIVIHAGITGQTIDMRGPRCPIGTLPEDGKEYSTTQYGALFAEIGYTYGGSGGVFRVPDSRGKANMGSISIPNATGSGTVATNNATFTSHQFNRSGIRVRLVSGTLTGLANNTNYYTIYVDNNTLAFATTYANAIAGTKVTISGTNSAVIRQSVTNANTAYGNEIEDTFQGHEHNYYMNQSGTGNPQSVGTGGFRGVVSYGVTNNTTNAQARFGDVTAPYSLITTKCIKY